MTLLERFCNGANKISTPPNRSSYYWRESFSLLSFVVLYAIYLERLISLLQIGKYFYRRFHPSSKDPASKRPNVPSWVVELYYFVVVVFLTIVVLRLNEFPCLLKGFAYYLFIDSTVWVLYYFFFRRFYEEKYAIMHSLEYIVVLPLVILSQAMEIHIITDWKYSIGESISMLINPNVGTPVPILLVSVLYVAVIFGLIISNLPLENIKEKGDYHYHMLVVGYGDVVKNRLQKALRAHFFHLKSKLYFNVAYYDPQTITSHSEQKPFRRFHENFFRLDDSTERTREDFKKDILRSNIVWIATPPSHHFKYLERYCRTNPLVVVEKPATIYRREFEAIRTIRQVGQDNVFYLSYYTLEKALPLTFLYRPLDFYEKYLDFHGSKREQLLAALSSLGKVKNITVEMIEGNDSRDWAFRQEEGGQLFETFIHPLCITRLVLGILPPAGRRPGIQCIQDPEGRIVDISLHSRFADCDIHLHMQKQANVKKRSATLQYENGEIIMDMDTRSLTMTQNGVTIALISIKEPFGTEYKNQNLFGEIYKSEYTVQLDMVLRCFGDKVAPSSVDCSDIQFDALDWLFKIEF